MQAEYVLAALVGLTPAVIAYLEYPFITGRIHAYRERRAAIKCMRAYVAKERSFGRL